MFHTAPANLSVSLPACSNAPEHYYQLTHGLPCYTHHEKAALAVQLRTGCAPVACDRSGCLHFPDLQLTPGVALHMLTWDTLGVVARLRYPTFESFEAALQWLLSLDDAELESTVALYALRRGVL